MTDIEDKDLARWKLEDAKRDDRRSKIERILGHMLEGYSERRCTIERSFSDAEKVLLALKATKRETQAYMGWFAVSALKIRAVKLKSKARQGNPGVPTWKRTLALELIDHHKTVVGDATDTAAIDFIGTLLKNYGIQVTRDQLVNWRKAAVAAKRRER